MKKILFSLLIMHFGEANGQQKCDIASITLANAILQEVINDSSILFDSEKKQQGPKMVIDHFFIWDSLSLVFPIDQLPTSEQKRMELNKTENEPYNSSYIFSPVEVDSLFSADDRLCIADQGKALERYIPFSYSSKDILVVTNAEKHQSSKMHYAFSYPLFSRNKRVAVIRKYYLLHYYEKTHDYIGIWRNFGPKDKYLGAWVTMYYKKYGSNWRLVYTTPPTL